MITRIFIDGFKSFRQFEMELTPFTVVAGLNASGKSNLFDALELLSRLAAMSLKEAFPERRGSVAELFTLVHGDTRLTSMSFEVDLLVGRSIKDNWGQQAEIKSPRLRYALSIERRTNSMGFEELFVTKEALAKIPPSEDSWARTYIGERHKAVWKSDQPGGSAKPFIETEILNGVPTVAVRQDGRQGRKATPAHSLGQTVLAGISSADFPHVFAAKEEMRSWRFMQLSPEELRKPTMQDAKMSYYLTHQGANLAAALYRIKQTDSYALVEISRQLMQFLPDFVEVDVVNDEANKQFVAVLRHKDGTVFTSRVLSEGTLRVLALVVMQADPEHQGLLCFEEPENGIHPMRIKHMVELLHLLSTDFEADADSLRQVIVNTHSPLIVREMAALHQNPAASVWLSRMSAQVAALEDGRRVSMRCTEIRRADGDPQMSIDGSRLNMADLIQYLSVLNDGEEQAGPQIAAIR